MSEKADEYCVYSREKDLSKSLVGAIVLIEECGGGVESIAYLFCISMKSHSHFVLCLVTINLDFSIL